MSKDDIGVKRVRRADERMTEAIVRTSEMQQDQSGNAAGGDKMEDAPTEDLKDAIPSVRAAVLGK